jgi:hypothetical protein
MFDTQTDLLRDEHSFHCFLNYVNYFLAIHHKLTTQQHQENSNETKLKIRDKK